MLCSCGHDEDRHAAMHDSDPGPCLRCNCSHFEKVTLESVQDDLPEVGLDEFTAHRNQLLRSLGPDAA